MSESRFIGCSVFGLMIAWSACSGQIGDSPAAVPAGTGANPNKNGSGTAIPSTGSGNSAGWYEALTAADCSAVPAAYPSSRVWRLSAEQWKNTVAAGLGLAPPDVSSFPADPIDPISGFSNDATDTKVSFELASAYLDASDAVAAQAAGKALTALSCLGTAPIAAACGALFVADYGQRLFRRALTDAEKTSYANYLASESALDPPATAVATILKAMMMSPNFVFRTELGDSKPGVVDLTQAEIASMLSYTIADSPPDEQLSAAADKGQLSDAITRQAQALRLAALPAAKEKLASFWNQYLALGTAPTAAGIDASMFTEAQNFFGKVVWDQNGTFKDLMTAPYTYADATVAAVYGSGTPDSSGRLSLDPQQRAGFLTSASMLVQTAAASQAATVIHRGLLVRQRALCETPPPPPPDVQRDPAQIQTGGADATARENYDLFKMSKPGCDACHSTFQPLGLAFEAYDAAGTFRTAYPGGKPIDTTATLAGAGDADGDFASAVDLIKAIGKSQIGQYCFTEQFAQFAFGRAINLDAEACTIRSMGDFVRDKGGQLTQLFGSITAAPTAFRRFHQ
ncbi:MAG TPA: DUF1592 domain-containing protein [Polyangia bacterium]|jgi:hypothetical protein|nr:DUF1592 domain-containing protein [Polyangia bacterium]